VNIRSNGLVPSSLLAFLSAILIVITVGCSDTGNGQAGGDCDASSCGTNASCDVISGECECNAGFADCDGDPANGCETEGSCACEFGIQRNCYDGPTSTLDEGLCQGGTQSCLGTEWGPCEGQVLPQLESCEPNNVDEDCDGVVDEDEDADGDGYGRCDGDCCDSIEERCAEDPSLVNPGAYDFPGNELDDDCDGIVDNPLPTDCSPATMISGIGARNLVEAMDLCQFTTDEEERWGVLSSQLLRANGVGTTGPLQVGVLEELGSVVPAVENATMAVLSSGEARGVNDPNYTGNRSVSSNSGQANVPAVYLNANQGQLASNPNCESGSSEVFDSVLLRLRIRVPTNAQGLQFQFRFFSHEYPIYLCTMFNDFFLALLASQHPDIPDDYNISFDATGNPVSVNNAFFTSCEALSCGGNAMLSGPDVSPMDGCVDSLTCNATTNLCETSLGACPDGPGDVLAYDPNSGDSGATAWLTTSAPVVPGEIIWLDFHIWDTGDSALDSLVLLDNFEWLLEPTEVITKL
jgi:hypothetical protein